MTPLILMDEVTDTSNECIFNLSRNHISDVACRKILEIGVIYLNLTFSFWFLNVIFCIQVNLVISGDYVPENRRVYRKRVGR
jgi:hypothetical protein